MVIYPNNVIGQDHRFIKKRISPSLSALAASASRTIIRLAPPRGPFAMAVEPGPVLAYAGT
jgi:hypothetical protein